jgi:glycosyltransferase involved in cell wall biosynthesis
MRFPLPVDIPAHGPPRSDEYRDALTAICEALDVGLIHVHHLMHHTVDIADVAAACGIPYVITLHDYYAVCPSYTLLDPDARPCRACIGVEPRRSSEACMTHAGLPASALPEFQIRMERFLAGAARIFVPSATARDVVGRRFPKLVPGMSVIEHGHRRAPGDTAPRRDGHGRSGPLRVAVIGGLEPHKGSRVFRDLLRANRRPETMFHFYGIRKDPALDGETFVDHGAYEGSGEIVPKLRDDGIHVGLLLSVWPETWSYTLSEFVDAGIPVIAGALGAPAERIERHRLGWVVPDITDPQATLAILDELLADPARLSSVASGMRREDALVPLETMWRRYLEHYRELLRSGRASMDSDARYLAWLGMTQVDLERRMRELEATIERQRALLDSPRHRIAGAVGDALQKIPVVWPVVAGVTEAVLHWRRAGRARG